MIPRRISWNLNVNPSLPLVRIILYLWKLTIVFSKIDVPPGQTLLLNGKMPDSALECAYFESKISALGGIHLLITALGENGSIGLNTKGESLNSRTRVVDLPTHLVGTSMAIRLLTL